MTPGSDLTPGSDVTPGSSRGRGHPVGSHALRPTRRFWSTIIRSFAFLRKEIVEILRQPRLVALLVAGPFLLLVMFGMAYGNDTLTKSAVFVGDEDSVYADVIASYEDQLADMIELEGMVPTLEEGQRMLDAGDVDVVVVFPEHPEAAITAGEQAVIRVLHDEIDPIQAGAVEIAARLAIQEANATVLATIAASTQAELGSPEEASTALSALARQIEQNPSGTRDDVIGELDRIGPALDGTATVLSRLQGEDPERQAQLDAVRAQVAVVSTQARAIDDTSSDAEVRQFAASVDALAQSLGDAIVLDPNVLVRPFTADTENVSGSRINPTDYFTPGSLALLLQHLALTFAALSLVRDRRTGLFELMRVGPLSSFEIITGKIFAYLLVGSIVAVALVGAATVGLGVSLKGSLWWMALVVVGVLVASLSLGMILSIISATESQAVQFAMLALLGGLFFSGFMLPLEPMRYPVKVVSWLLPVTYGIQGFQDIMLRGRVPDRITLIGLGALVVVYGSLAVIGLRRQLRHGDDG